MSMMILALWNGEILREYPPHTQRFKVKWQKTVHWFNFLFCSQWRLIWINPTVCHHLNLSRNHLRVPTSWQTIMTPQIIIIKLKKLIVKTHIFFANVKFLTICDLVQWEQLGAQRSKTEEMTVAFRKSTATPTTITGDSTINTVKSYCFLGTIISQDLKWKLNISSLIKEAQWRTLACQKGWWCPYTPSSIPSSLTPSPSGTLLPLPGTRADCSISFALLIRWWAAICHHSRTCTLQGLWGVLSNPPIPDTNFLRLSSLQSIRTKTSGHENSFFPSATSLTYITLM